ncbi:hypothetical protein R84981_001931 [Carnimonas sp. R-84981]|uniref:hypothetical protein n=1 Tax=Carnimonas bestiolae TaxID=3402172 RepID=UPI003EDC39AD
MPASRSGLPGFLHIVTGDGALPVAIAWSLKDGRIKHTLIQPLESWLEEENIGLEGFDESNLYGMGVSPLDVIRELEMDHDSETLYVTGTSDEEGALERIYAEYGLNPVVELANAWQLYSQLDREQWEDERRELFEERGLTPMSPEHEVEAMLFLHQRFADEWPEDAPPRDHY